jgi:hypothetical protein
VDIISPGLTLCPYLYSPKRRLMAGRVISVIAIIGIVYLSRLAILHGIDGVALSSCATALGVIAGFYFKDKKRRR